MKMANLKEEIKRRFEEDKVTYETIGAEIKRHRLALSLTLQSVSSTGCSPSYICKIERNQVKPSSKYLKEICKKVNISEDKIDYLLNSKDISSHKVRLSVQYGHDCSPKTFPLQSALYFVFEISGFLHLPQLANMFHQRYNHRHSQ